MFSGNRKFAHFSNIWKRKRPSNIVEFCNFCWKMAKKRTFSYKVACKKFSWSGQRGGHRTMPPLNTPLHLHGVTFPSLSARHQSTLQDYRYEPSALYSDGVPSMFQLSLVPIASTTEGWPGWVDNGDWLQTEMVYPSHASYLDHMWLP